MRLRLKDTSPLDGVEFKETAIVQQIPECLLQMYVDILPRQDCDFVYSRSIDLLDRSRVTNIADLSLKNIICNCFLKNYIAFLHIYSFVGVEKQDKGNAWEMVAHLL